MSTSVPREFGAFLKEHRQDMLTAVADAIFHDGLGAPVEIAPANSCASPVELADPQGLGRILRSYPPIAEAQHEDQGRLLLLGEYRGRSGLRVRARLHTIDGWKRSSELQAVVSRAFPSGLTVRGIRWERARLGRYALMLDNEVLHGFTSWFSTTERGAIVLPRENWEAFEPRFRGVSW